MKTRMFLFATTFLMMAAGAGFGSCIQSNGVMNTDDSQQTAVKAKAHVKLSISPTISVSSSTMQSRKAFSWSTFDVTEATTNQRVYDASVNAGKQNRSIAYYVAGTRQGIYI